MISTFKKSVTEWVKSGKSEFAIKDSKEFTDLITQNAREVFVNKTSQLDTADVVINKQQWLEGEIFVNNFLKKGGSHLSKRVNAMKMFILIKEVIKGRKGTLYQGKKFAFYLILKKENNEILYFATKS